MMTPERRAHLRDITEQIASDAEADTTRRDGQEFNGRNVAAALGETNAMIMVLSQIVGEMLQASEVTE